MMSRHGTTSRTDVLAFWVCHSEAELSSRSDDPRLTESGERGVEGPFMKEASAFSISAMNMP
jgi:hypothetical protein